MISNLCKYQISNKHTSSPVVLYNQHIIIILPYISVMKIKIIHSNSITYCIYTTKDKRTHVYWYISVRTHIYIHTDTGIVLHQDSLRQRVTYNVYSGYVGYVTYTAEVQYPTQKGFYGPPQPSYKKYTPSYAYDIVSGIFITSYFIWHSLYHLHKSYRVTKRIQPIFIAHIYDTQIHTLYTHINIYVYIYAYLYMKIYS